MIRFYRVVVFPTVITISVLLTLLGVLLKTDNFSFRSFDEYTPGKAAPHCKIEYRDTYLLFRYCTYRVDANGVESYSIRSYDGVIWSLTIKVTRRETFLAYIYHNNLVKYSKTGWSKDVIDKIKVSAIGYTVRSKPTYLIQFRFNVGVWGY